MQLWEREAKPGSKNYFSQQTSSASRLPTELRALPTPTPLQAREHRCAAGQERCHIIAAAATGARANKRTWCRTSTGSRRKARPCCVPAGVAQTHLAAPRGCARAHSRGGRACMTVTITSAEIASRKTNSNAIVTMACGVGGWSPAVRSRCLAVLTSTEGTQTGGTNGVRRLPCSEARRHQCIPSAGSAQQ